MPSLLLPWLWTLLSQFSAWSAAGAAAWHHSTPKYTSMPACWPAWEGGIEGEECPFLYFGTYFKSIRLLKCLVDYSPDKISRKKISCNCPPTHFQSTLVLHPRPGLNFESLLSQRPEGWAVQAKYWLVPGEGASAEYSKVLSVVRLWLSAGRAPLSGETASTWLTIPLSLSHWPEPTNNQTYVHSCVSKVWVKKTSDSCCWPCLLSTSTTVTSVF